MMLLATMTFLPPAATRTPIFNGLFGEEGWWTFNSSMVIFGALVLIIRLLTHRAIDRWFAIGFACLIGVMLLNEHLAVGDSWGRIAKWILQN